MNNILNSYINNCSRVIGGISELYIANYQKNLNIIYSSPLSFDLIKEIKNDIQWFEFGVKEKDSKVEEKVSFSIHGKIYNQSISLLFDVLDFEKRRTLDQLLNGKVIIIFKDLHQKYWILGEETGLKASDYKAGSEDNQYSILLSTISKNIMKQVESSYVSEIIKPVVCGQYADLTWGDETVPFFQIANCEFADFE